MNLSLLRGLTLGAVLAGAGASAWAKGFFPSKASLLEFPTAVGLTLDVAGTTNCAVLVTGTTFFQQSATTVSGSTNTVATEIVAMDLVGRLPDGSAVRVRAGLDLIGLPSTGQVISTNSVFPADATMDLIVQIELPGGTNAQTAAAIPLATRVRALPPINETFTNLTAVALVDAGDTNTVIGQLTQLWLQPAESGKTAVVGVSLDVTATNTIATVAMEVCDETAEPSAVARIKRSDLSGSVAPNLTCDEILGANLLFAAKLDKTLRAPDWRGAHKGNWILYTLGSNGKTNLVAFGKLEGTEGVGTHRLPEIGNAGDDCAACAHFEGKLSGKLIDKTLISGGKIEASYAGRYLDTLGNPLGCCPPPPAPPQGPVVMTIDGVIITKCLPLPLE